MNTRLRIGERRPCEACGTAIVGARTRSGAKAPVVLEPSDIGNVLLFRTPSGDTECRTFSGAVLEKLREEGVPLRVNHFANCPERERFERRS